MILVDTGPLVALCDTRDAYHARAADQLGRLARAGLAACDAVLAEACFLLPHRHQRLRLRAVLEVFDIRQAPATPDEEFRSEVFDWLAKYAGHEPDWADGCLAVLAGRDRTAKVWSYDSEFRTTWRRPDGSAIPMAVKPR